MARLQILELPEGSGDDRPPFMLVIDQVPSDEAGFDAIRRDLLSDGDLAPRLGARAVLCFEDTITIPANDTSAHFTDDVRNEVTIKLGDRDVQKTREANEDHILDSRQARLDAQELADERTDIARDMDRLAKWKNELLDALGMDRTRDWDDIRNAARGLRKKTEDLAAKIERVLRLPETPQQGVGAEAFDYLNGYRDATRAALSALVNPADDQSLSDA